MPISRDEVARAYRFMFGREPGSEAAIKGKLHHQNIESLCAELVASEEMSHILQAGTARMVHADYGERYVIVKELVLAEGQQAAVLVAHAPVGRLKPHVLAYLKMLHDSGSQVLLVVVVDRPLELLDEEVAAAQGIIVRDNTGYDFGAWAHALRLQPHLFGAGLLILTNDSVVPTADPAVFQAMMDRVRDNPADVVGLTASHEYGWHVQSYFLSFKPRALGSWALQQFIRDIRSLDGKHAVVRAYEVPFAARMQQAGLTTAAIYTSSMPANPTFFGWRELIEQGFPFIKLLMLRGQFAALTDWPEVLDDIRDNWREVLSRAGFNVDLVGKSIRAADITSVPPGGDTNLLVRGDRFSTRTADHTCRVAYFGAWNYEDVGDASRALLCALRHTGLALNAYPVMRPFAHHRLICPAVETIDFSTRPDVAIVHLDPGSWHLLTGDQLGIIRSAKRLIGYGEWQSSDLPGSCARLALDRVWAPDQPSVDALFAQAGVAGDIIPLPGPVLQLSGVKVVGAQPDPIAASPTRPSFAAVAKLIEASIAAVTAEDNEGGSAGGKPNIVPPPPQLKIDFSSGQRFAQLAPDAGVVPVPLAADLSWMGGEQRDGDEADWLFFAPSDAYVCPGAADLIVQASLLRPDVVLFYADDAAADGPMLDRIRLKPDFDRTLFVAQDYIGAPVIVRRDALKLVGGLDPSRGSAMMYDLVLRIADAGGTIGRIPRVLIGSEHERPKASLDERRLALFASPGLRDVDLVAAAIPGQLHQRRRIAAGAYPGVTIIVPTCRSTQAVSGEAHIERLLNGIANSNWPMQRLTVIVGDDIPEKPDWAKAAWPFKLKWVATPRAVGQPFNYAAKMNRLWRAATDEQVILMNDDVLPHGLYWLNALVGFASDHTIGGVGPRLYYEDGSLQHVGMLQASRAVVHAWPSWPADEKTYQDWAQTQREWSMITGAVFATRRSILEQVNGFDERFSLELNDVDLCLRIRSLGYRIVFNPDAEFTHVEKASRGNAVPPGPDLTLFLSRWSRWLDEDPASHPGLDHDRRDLVPKVASDAWYLQEP